MCRYKRYSPQHRMKIHGCIEVTHVTVCQHHTSTKLPLRGIVCIDLIALKATHTSISCNSCELLVFSSCKQSNLIAISTLGLVNYTTQISYQYVCGKLRSSINIHSNNLHHYMLDIKNALYLGVVLFTSMNGQLSTVLLLFK